MRRPRPVPRPSLRFLMCQIPAWLGMLIYAFINVLLFFGVFSAAWAGYMSEPLSFTAYLSAFMFPAGSSALLLAPLAYGLLRWRCSLSPFHLFRGMGYWAGRLSLIPCWLPGK